MTDKLPNPDALQEAVSAYFQEVVTASLELPDGWFGGRPMDSLHQLTFITSRPGRLIVELDEHLLLTFAGPTRGSREVIAPEGELATTELAITEFSQLVFDQRSYGSGAWDAEVYRSGQVKFAAWRRPGRS